jgi:DNA polymerase I-like protein with 3'-5' exonuclease and polymerase domains
MNMRAKSLILHHTKQLGDILYKKLKIVGTKKTKKGNYATNVNILEDLAFQGHDLPQLILDWRQKSKLKKYLHGQFTRIYRPKN